MTPLSFAQLPQVAYSEPSRTEEKDAILLSLPPVTSTLSPILTLDALERDH